jgi:hypothetical protein
MRVARTVREGVVLAVYGDPLLATLTRGQPEQHPKEHVRDRMDHERPMREPSMQVDRRRDDSELRERDGDERNREGVKEHSVSISIYGVYGGVGPCSHLTLTLIPFPRESR